MEFRLRNIPDDLWRHFKSQCALEGKTITDKLMELIRVVAEKGKPK
jgi:hypothetical protein